MFRKLMLALAATATIGAAALAPTAASAGGGKFFYHGHGYGWGGVGLYVGGPSYVVYDSCWVKRWVDTPFGPRLRRVYICD